MAADALARSLSALPQGAPHGSRRSRTYAKAYVALSSTLTPASASLLGRMRDKPEAFGRSEEVIRAILGVMSRENGRRYCLQQLKRVAEQPDESPGRVEYLLSALLGSADPQQVNVVSAILSATRNESIRRACLRALSRCVTQVAGSRDDLFRHMRTALADDSPVIRAEAAQALGASGQVQFIKNMAPLLDDPAPQVRDEAARAICTLLKWKRVHLTDKESVEAFKTRLQPVLQALEALDAAAKQNAE